MDKEIVKNNMEGPCCQIPLLVILQIDVAKAKIRVNNTAVNFFLQILIKQRYMKTTEREDISEAEIMDNKKLFSDMLISKKCAIKNEGRFITPGTMG